MIRKIAVLAFALTLTTGTAFADAYKIDATHSGVSFSVRHMGIAKVHGTFNEFAGTVQYDAADTSKWAVDVTIQSASVDTRSENRDNHLRSDDFFNAETYPTITFKSTGVKAKADGTFALTGNLTMRDVTKPVTLDVEMLGAITDARGNERIAFSATTTIKRLDYGVKWSKTLDTGGLVGSDDVKIEIELAAVMPKSEG